METDRDHEIASVFDIYTTVRLGHFEIASLKKTVKLCVN